MGIELLNSSGIVLQCVVFQLEWHSWKNTNDAICQSLQNEAFLDQKLPVLCTRLQITFLLSNIIWSSIICYTRIFALAVADVCMPLLTLIDGIYLYSTPGACLVGTSITLHRCVWCCEWHCQSGTMTPQFHLFEFFIDFDFCLLCWKACTFCFFLAIFSAFDIFDLAFTFGAFSSSSSARASSLSLASRFLSR